MIGKRIGRILTKFIHENEYDTENDMKLLK